MTGNDPLSDALSGLNNAENAGHLQYTAKPASTLIGNVFGVFRDYGYIGQFEHVQDGKAGYFDVELNEGIYHIARDDSESFTWQDIPSINEQDRNAVKSAFSQFTRTALSYREIYYPFLTEKWGKAKNESWLRNTVLKQGVNLNNDETALQFTSILRYFESYLEWIATMIHHSSEATKNGINLIDVNQFSQFDSTHHENGVSLSEKLRDQQLKQFGNLIAETKSGNLTKVFLRMNYAKVPKDRAGIGAFIGALYESCKL